MTKQQVINLMGRAGLITDNGKEWYAPGNYYLAHGEYAPNRYIPRRYKDGWGVHREVYFYEGTFYAPKSGRYETENLVFRAREMGR